MLKTMPVKNFERCYQKWEQRLYRRVAAQGNYFEGITLMFEKIKTLVNKRTVSLLFCHTSYVRKQDPKANIWALKEWEWRVEKASQ